MKTGIRLKILRPDRAWGFESPHQHHLNRPFDARLVSIAAKQHGDMPDSLHQYCVGPSAECFNYLLARIAILGVHANLDQFMVIERLIDFLADPWCDAMVANNHHGFAMMGQRFKMTFLRWGQGEHA